MTPADRRITELIDKWLASIDLHLQYVELSDAAYARAQAWPRHDRPTRWVLEVARQKILELRGQCETRQAMGDSKFSESLELMAFLANLVGIQHIQRFIPLAEGSRQGRQESTSNSQTVEMPTAAKVAAARPKSNGEDTTREMPKLKPAPAPKPAVAAPAKARTEAKPAARSASTPAAAPKAAPAPKPAAPKAAAAAAKPITVDLRGKIVADAVRLLKWGKSWHELADLIARIADRPQAGEIRKVLRAHKGEIEERATR